MTLLISLIIAVIIFVIAAMVIRWGFAKAGLGEPWMTIAILLVLLIILTYFFA